MDATAQVPDFVSQYESGQKTSSDTPDFVAMHEAGQQKAAARPASPVDQTTEAQRKNAQPAGAPSPTPDAQLPEWLRQKVAVARGNIAKYPRNAIPVQQQQDTARIRAANEPRIAALPPDQQAKVRAEDEMWASGDAAAAQEKARQAENPVSIVPQAAMPALSVANKVLVEPFEKMSALGGRVGKDLAVSAVATGGFGEGTMGNDGELSDPNRRKELVEQFKQEYPRATGIVGAVGQTAGGVAADPRMWPLMFTGSAPVAASRAMSAGFAAQMAHGANEQAKQLGEIWDRSDIPQDQKWELGASVIISTLMATTAGRHAAKSGAVPLPTDEATKALMQYESVTGNPEFQAKPEPKPQINLDPDKVQTIGALMANLPHTDRQGIITKLYPQLADQLLKTGSFLGPDGKLQVVKTPEEAGKLAQQFINEAVDAHDKRVADEQKAQAEAAEETKTAKAAVQKPVQNIPKNSPAGRPAEYQEAVDLVTQFGKASTSLLQRRLRIGYGRAAHLIDLMEQDGIVGAADGARPRELFRKPAADATGKDSIPPAPVAGHSAEAMTRDVPAVKASEQAPTAPGQQPQIAQKIEPPENQAKLEQPALPAPPEGIERIGDQHKESGRTILQPTDDPVHNDQLAGEAAPELTTRLSQVAAAVKGATFDRLRPQKDLPRIEEKVEDDGKPPQTVPDYLAAQLVADSPKAKDELLKQLEKEFGKENIVQVEDSFTAPRKDLAGYASTNVQVKMPNGITAEVQIVPREVQESSIESHKFYSAGREAELRGDTAERDKQFAQAEKLNKEALERFEHRNAGYSGPDRRANRIAPDSTSGIRLSELRQQLREAQQSQDMVAQHETQEAINREVANAKGEHYPIQESKVEGIMPEDARRHAETAPPVQLPPRAQSVDKLERGQVGTVDPQELTFDSKRFQYKLNVNEKGVSNLLAGKRWNPDLAGVVSVWRDPVDGKTYVVNGHHRARLALDAGRKELLVKHINVNDASEARALGALQNIAEGRGTAVDAAKFFRETGMTPEKLDQHGISLGEATATNGLALSRLDPSVFERVATGQMTEARGVAIGEATADPAQQEAIVKLLDKQESQGRKITNDTISELARFVSNSGNRTVEQGGLFGANQEIHSLALEKAEVSAYIKQQIAKERRVFGAVASEGKAEALKRVEGQQIKAGENARISQAARQAEEAYNKLSSYAGPVNTILEKASRDLASGNYKPEDVKRIAYQAIRAELSKTVGGGPGPGSARVSEAEGTRKADAGKPEGPLYSVERQQAPTFFSKAEKVADEKLPKIASAQSVIPTLKNAGVKDEEIKWSGLDDFLKDKKLVRKEDLLTFIRENNVQVKEVGGGFPRKVDRTEELSAKQNDVNRQMEQWYAEHPEGIRMGEQRATWGSDGSRGGYTFFTGKIMEATPSADGRMLWRSVGSFGGARSGKGRPSEKFMSELKGAAEARGVKWQDVGHNKEIDRSLYPHELMKASKTAAKGISRQLTPTKPTKYGQHVLPGGNNYRELLLTLPEKPSKRVADIDAQMDALHEKGDITTDPKLRAEYDRLLKLRNSKDDFLPPPQFKSSHFDEPNILAHVRFNDRVDADGKKVLFLEELQSDWHQEGRREGYQGPLSAQDKQRFADLGKEWGNVLERRDAGQLDTGSARARLDELQREMNRLSAKKHQGVPDAPFKTSWHELALKRVLRYAAENGYDRIGWTTGEQQAERYDLSKHIDRIEATKTLQGHYAITATDKSGTTVIDDVYRAEKLPDVVGKELADRIVREVKSEPTPNQRHNKIYSGLDLKVGGQGMKGFYDKILPDFLNKYGKKWGAKVGETRINQYQPTHEFDQIPFGTTPKGQAVHSLDITPAMRDSVLYEGQPLFNLSSSDLLSWAKSAGSRIKVEAMGQQGGLFGGEEKMFRLSTSKQNSVTATEAQVRDLAQQMPSLARKLDQQDIITDDSIRFDYQPPEAATLFGGQKPPILTISRGARDLIADRSGSVKFNAANMSAERARLIADKVEPENPQLAEALRKAADDAGHSGITLHKERATQAAIEEEQVHAGQRQLGRGEVTEHLPGEALDHVLDHPATEQLRNDLKSQGYPELSKAHEVVEMAAHIATGQHSLTPEQAADWFTNYVDQLHKEHGEGNVAAAFANMYDTARDLYERSTEELAARAARPGGRESGIQSSAGGVPEHPTGAAPPETGRGNQKGATGKQQGSLDQPFLLSAEKPERSEGEDLYARLRRELQSEPAARPHIETPPEPERDFSGSPQTPRERPGESGFARLDLPAAVTEAVKKAAPAVRDLIRSSYEKLEHSREAAATAREVEDGIFTLQKQREADILAGARAMKDISTTPEEQERLFHYGENTKGEKISAKEKEVFESTIKPLMEVTAHDRALLKAKGVPVEDPEGNRLDNQDWMHRVVEDKSSMLQRAASRVKGASTGNILKTSAASAKGRTMMALEDENTGERAVVSIKRDLVTKFEHGQPEDMGRLRSGLSTKFALQDERLDPVAERIIELQKQVKEFPEEARQKTIEQIQSRMEDLKKQQETLAGVKGRTLGKDSAYGVEPTFSQRKAITEELDRLEKKLESARGASDSSYMNGSQRNQFARIKDRLAKAEAARSEILEQGPSVSAFNDQVWTDRNGREWKITNATAKEIEQHTNVRYFKNALASAVSDFIEVRSALRAQQYLERLLNSPESQAMVYKSKNGSLPPEGWKMTSVPQLRGYHFEPHTAEVLERLYEKSPQGFMAKAARAIQTSLLFNPLVHIANVGVHWVGEKGVSGWLNPLKYPEQARAGIKAIKAVMTQNDDYLAALDAGTPLMSHQDNVRQLNKFFFETLAGRAATDSKLRGFLADYLGIDSLNVVKDIYQFSRKTTWLSNDIFFLQSVYEKTGRGTSMPEAIAETAKHIPDYRIPTRVLGSSRLSSLMRNQQVSMFSAYHYGMVKSYGHMIKEVFGGDRTLSQRAKGVDHMLALGLMTFGFYKVADKILKKMTGDPNARMRRAGASSLPDALTQVAQGKMEPGDALMSVVTPAAASKNMAELAFDRDFRSGERIYDRHDTAGNIAKDVGGRVAGMFGPVQSYDRFSRQDKPGSKFAWSLAGVTFPKNESRSPAQRLMFDILHDNMPQMTPERRREMAERQKRVASGNLSQREQKAAWKKEAMGDFEYYLPELKFQDIQRILKEATPEERQVILPILQLKALHLMERDPEAAERLNASSVFDEK